LHQWEDTNIAYGVPMIDEKRTELGDGLTQYHSTRPVTNTIEIPSESPSGLHTRIPTPSQPVNPSPTPARRRPAPLPSISVRGDDNNGDGNQAVSGEYAFGYVLEFPLGCRISTRSFTEQSCLLGPANKHVAIQHKPEM